MNDVKKKKLLSMFITAALLICVAMTLISCTKQNLPPIYEGENLESECKELTDSDYIDELGIGIGDFITNLENNLYMPKNVGKKDSPVGKYDVDKALKRLIPEALLSAQSAQYAFVGSEYSFAVSIQAPVMQVMFVDNVYGYDTNSMRISIGVKPFSRTFKHISGEDAHWEDAGKLGKKDAKFYVKDVEFSFLITNEHGANPNDSDYDMAKDNYPIIRQSQVNYGLFKVYDSEYRERKDGTVGVNKVLGATRSVSSEISGLAEYRNELNRLPRASALIIDRISDQWFDVENRGKNYYLTDYSRSWQLNNAITLAKAVVISPNRDGHIFVTDGAEAAILLDDSNNEVGCMRGAKYDIVRYNGAEITKLNLSGSVAAAETILYERVFTASGGTNEGYNRAESSRQIWEFVPKWTGEYTLSASSGQVYVRDKGVLQELTEEMYLQNNKTYCFAVSGVKTGKYTLDIEFTPPHIGYGEHEVKIDNYNDEKCYTIVSDEPREFNIALSSSVSTDVYLQQDDKTVLVFGGSDSIINECLTIQGKVILRIVNRSSSSATVNFSLTPAHEVELDTSCYIGYGYKAFFKYTTEWQGHYSVSNAGHFTVTIYDEDFHRVGVYDTSLISFYLDGNKTYYFKIEHSGLYATSLNFELCGDPEILTYGENTVTQDSRKHAYKFVGRSFDTYYIINADGLELSLYDGEWNEIGERCDDGIRIYLEQDEYCYIVTEGDSGEHSLNIRVQTSESTSVVEPEGEYICRVDL